MTDNGPPEATKMPFKIFKRKKLQFQTPAASGVLRSKDGMAFAITIGGGPEVRTGQYPGEVQNLARKVGRRSAANDTVSWI